MPEKIQCECGMTIAHTHMESHLGGKSHITAVNKLARAKTIAPEILAGTNDDPAVSQARAEKIQKNNPAQATKTIDDPYAFAQQKVGLPNVTIDPSLVNTTDYSLVANTPQRPVDKAESDFLKQILGEDGQSSDPPLTPVGLQAAANTPLPSEDDQVNPPIPSMINDHISSNDFIRDEEVDTFDESAFLAQMVSQRPRTIDPSIYEVDQPIGQFDPTTPAELSGVPDGVADTAALFTDGDARLVRPVDLRDNDDSKVEIVTTADGYDRVIGDQVRKNEAEFPWCYQEKTHHPHRFTRYYFRQYILLDLFANLQDSDRRAIMEKSRQIEAYNQLVPPTERIGYIPLMVNHALTPDAVAQARKRRVLSMAGAVNGVSQFGFEFKVIDGAITRVPKQAA